MCVVVYTCVRYAGLIYSMTVAMAFHLTYNRGFGVATPLLANVIAAVAKTEATDDIGRTITIYEWPIYCS